jgi:hypothetical protein
VQRATFFTGAVVFWQKLEEYGPDAVTRLHARGILRALAEGSYADCGGPAL